jgi:signal transduction histidine kinase
LHRAERQTTRLGTLIDELLDVARLSSGRLVLNLQDVELGALVEEVSERFMDASSSKGSRLSLHVHERMVGRWDRLRLDQVLTNLLANAVKYGEGKPIDVSVAREHGRAVVLVVDHGMGVDPLATERIFERFERAASHRNYGGFGLGLWISRQIVEALGGTIRLDSDARDGTTFRVDLPFEQNEPVPVPGATRIG